MDKGRIDTVSGSTGGGTPMGQKNWSRGELYLPCTSLLGNGAVEWCPIVHPHNSLYSVTPISFLHLRFSHSLPFNNLFHITSFPVGPYLPTPKDLEINSRTCSRFIKNLVMSLLGSIVALGKLSISVHCSPVATHCKSRWWVESHPPLPPCFSLRGHW